MKVETTGGAVIATLILIASNLGALFTSDPELTLGAIPQATWIVMATGAAAAFLKDYQAVSTRRGLGKLTGGGTV